MVHETRAQNLSTQQHSHQTNRSSNFRVHFYRKKFQIPHKTGMSRIKRVCLFGTSANPPTGLGGHAGIVKFLASMIRDDQSNELLFDEVRVLPVYKHMFQVSRLKLLKLIRRVSQSLTQI